MNKHLNLLGLAVEDKVTKTRGIVDSISFDLYGCVQAVVNRGFTKDGKPDSVWMDVSRLRIMSQKPVMNRPNFVDGPQAEGQQGPAFKP